MGDLVGSRFLLYTDAALKGSGFPGLGGWLHGLYFTLRIPDDMLGYFIVQQEFLAVIFAGLRFGKIVARTPTDLMTDSIMSHLILVNDAAHADQTRFLRLEFLRANTLKNGELLALGTCHVFGESKSFADFSSRGRISELHLLAEQMGIKTVETPPTEEFRAVLDRFRERFGPKPSTVKPRRPLVHATPASLDAANVVTDKDGHKGRPLVPFSTTPTGAN
jgi:hypothetical protein